MSLVGLLSTLLDLTAAVAAFSWLVSLYVGTGFHRAIWRLATADLRAEDPHYPAAAAGMAWLIAVIVALSLRATFTGLMLFGFVPFMLFAEFLVGSGRGSVTRRIKATLREHGPDPAAGKGGFRLPMDVYSSAASDVSRWTSRSVPIPRRSLLALGTSGSGKSETLKHFAEALLADPSPSRVVIYDHKADYEEFLRDRGREDDMLKVSTSESDVYWNVFREAETEAEYDEIARALFAGRDDDEGYFQVAGRQLLAANLRYLDRELAEPTNADLKRYFQQADAEKMYQNLTRDGHEDLTSAAAAIDPEAGRQAAGVFSTVQTVVSDVFVGDFAEDGEFSIREYMQRDDEKVIVLSRDARQAGTASAIFAHLIDRAIVAGMDDPETPFYAFLDEFEHLDAEIRRLSELINVGRGASSQAILSLQSVAQLFDTYGENRGKALLSGMTTSIILRCADSESVAFARSVIGSSFEEYTAHESTRTLPGGGSVTTGREVRREEEHAFAEGDFNKFAPGEAVIARQGEGHVHGRVEMLEE